VINRRHRIYGGGDGRPNPRTPTEFLNPTGARRGALWRSLGICRKTCSMGSAPANVHGGRWWTLRGRQKVRAPPAETTQLSAKQAETQSPLTDSNRPPPPYHRCWGETHEQRLFYRISLLLPYFRCQSHPSLDEA
jgi:hypothetical protein